MAIPNCAGAQMRSLFQVAIAPAKTEDSTKKKINIKRLAASYRGFLGEVAFEMSLVGRVGCPHLNVRVRKILEGNSWSKGTKKERKKGMECIWIVV